MVFMKIFKIDVKDAENTITDVFRNGLLLPRTEYILTDKHIVLNEFVMEDDMIVYKQTVTVRL